MARTVGDLVKDKTARRSLAGLKGRPSIARAHDLANLMPWLQQHVGYIDPRWVSRLMGVNRSTISKAIAANRVRTARFRLWNGYELVLVSLPDCARVIKPYRDGRLDELWQREYQAAASARLDASMQQLIGAKIIQAIEPEPAPAGTTDRPPRKLTRGRARVGMKLDAEELALVEPRLGPALELGRARRRAAESSTPARKAPKGQKRR